MLAARIPCQSPAHAACVVALLAGEGADACWYVAWDTGRPTVLTTADDTQIDTAHAFMALDVWGP